MANPFGLPGYTAAEFAQRRAEGKSMLVIDVREAFELEYANLGDGILHVPLSDLSRRLADALPEQVTRNPEQEIVVMCHHGNRSMQVTAWLMQQGYSNVFNLDGGIDAYAAEVDPSVGFY